MKKALLLLLLATPVFATEKKPIPQKGDKGDPGIQGIAGQPGADGSHSFQMPLGAGVRWFDTDKWQGVTSYQIDPIHSQHIVSGLVIYKVGPDATQARIDALNAKIEALNRILERHSTEEKPKEKGITIYGH